MASRYEDGNRRNKVRAKKWGWDRREVPVFEVKLRAHDGRYYRSGRVVFDSLEGRITLKVPWRPAWGFRGWFKNISGSEGGAVALRKIDQATDAVAFEGLSVGDVKEYTTIVEYLAVSKYPDGQARQTSSLVVLCDGRAWRVCLSDRDNGRTMWKTGQTLLEALEALELGLVADDPGDWRKAAAVDQKQKKRS